ncbi:hypothetical protein [Planctomyces sp. SH-PL14]|uniref:hypothetical protein n=1 Tax=Planctomyces sp. SH-PL14 TaxID=1632864 RepID=UPI00078C70A6|nr:hypothetical protein [Planctomyces sp. SH-PL14]AMV17918.1 hypothetical protein VT03_08515 [Planctomyces sp. SH-PL14]
MTTTNSVGINRTLVGAIALVCAASGGLIFFFVDSSATALGSALLRVSVLMGAFWLALPMRPSTRPVMQMSPILLAAIIAGLVFIVRRPGAFLPALFVLAVVAVVVRPWRR